MTRPAPRAYRVSLSLYVVFSLLMAVSAAASGLFLLYLARPFASELSGPQARQLAFLLFTGSSNAIFSLGSSVTLPLTEPIAAYQFTLNTQSSAGAKVTLVSMQSGIG